jgi:hypothetical protein
VGRYETIHYFVIAICVTGLSRQNTGKDDDIMLEAQQSFSGRQNE